MTVVTIGREFGSGGREIGIKLAEQLGYEFFDKELIAMAAEKTNFAHETIKRIEEQPPSSPIASQSLFAFYNTPSPADQLFFAQAELIQEIAKTKNAVIVGRAADYILRDEPEVLSVYVVADLEDRVERKRKFNPDMTDKELRSNIQKVDKRRAKYYNYYTDKSWNNAASYHMSVNTSKIGVDLAVDLIADAVEIKFHK